MLFQRTGSTAGTAVAHIRRFPEPFAFLSREFPAEPVAEMAAVLAFPIEASFTDRGDFAFITVPSLVERLPESPGASHSKMRFHFPGNG